MLRIGICDDEAGARHALLSAIQRLLEPEGEELTSFEFSSGEGVLHWLQSHAGALDILFLDIEMNGINGMETAQQIRQTDDKLLLVFVTGYTDYVFDGYAVSALDYLIKPIQPERLHAVLRRAFAAMQRQSFEVYTLRNMDGLFRIPKDKILYFYSDRRYVILVTNDREYAFYGKLDEVAQSIGNGFVRIHQRYLVYGAAVSHIEGNTVTINGVTLPLSRGYRQTAMLALAKAMLGKNG